MPLPAWLKQDEEKPNRFHIDSHVAYAEWLGTLQSEAQKHSGDWPAIVEKFGAPAVDGEDQDRNDYWRETVYQCVRLEAIFQIRQAGLDPRPEGALVLLPCSTKDDAGESKWKIINQQKTTLVANKGVVDGQKLTHFMAREHYKRIRGFLPE
jgi:hypothetical protein